MSCFLFDVGCQSSLETVLNLTLWPGTGQEAAWTIRKLSMYVTSSSPGKKNKKHQSLFGCVHNLLLSVFRALNTWYFPPKSSWVCPEKQKHSYIDGMILSVVEFLPAGWAGVGIPKGIAQALAAEDVATFGCHNQSSTLHNLWVAIHANGTADGTRRLGTCSFIL